MSRIARSIICWCEMFFAALMLSALRTVDISLKLSTMEPSRSRNICWSSSTRQFMQIVQFKNSKSALSLLEIVQVLCIICIGVRGAYPFVVEDSIIFQCYLIESIRFDSIWNLTWPWLLRRIARQEVTVIRLLGFARCRDSFSLFNRFLKSMYWEQMP